jgi:tetratricopeptide (TPR) repeat protein
MDPEYGDAYYFLGWMYNLTGNQDLAYQKLIKAEGLPLDQVNHSDLYYQLGKVAGSLGPAGESSALDYYTQAIVDNHFTYPFQAGDAHFQRAMIYRKKGWNERAIEELNYVITEYPTHYSAWVRLGYIAWDVEGDLSTAEYYFTQAIKLDDERLAAYFGLAHALQEAGMSVEAEDTYNKILTIDPQNQDALERLQQMGK